MTNYRLILTGKFENSSGVLMFSAKSRHFGFAGKAPHTPLDQFLKKDYACYDACCKKAEN
ncbi:MAG: hypothetical protein LBQ50_05510 [Planctomycetaceae bacterium]|nr:hypothetical protein [Planctomycetaceae bacterium]